MLKPLVLVLALLSELGLPGAHPASKTLELSPPISPVPQAYFGLHLHRATTKTTWPSANFGSWRLWDAYAIWPNLEPQPGAWEFGRVDAYVALAEQHRVEVVMPLGISPTWASARPADRCPYAPGGAAEPARMADWRAYVRTVATRYHGRIHTYEVWNEPNGVGYYSGSVETMVALVREARAVLHEVDPNIRLVSPAAVDDNSGLAWLEKFLAAGGGASCDVLAYHCYVAPRAPEAMLPLVARLHSLAARFGQQAKPLWSTEAGWEIASAQTTFKPNFGRPLSGEEAAAYVARAYVLAWAAGLERYFLYAWDHYTMGLVEPDGQTQKPAALAYAQVAEWLTGSRMTRCSADEAGIWSCWLLRPDGTTAVIAWQPSGPGRITLPSTWRSLRVKDLHAVYRRVQGPVVDMGPSPLLIEREGA